MLKFYRVGQTIHSLDGTSKTFESINQAKAHVRKIIRPGYGELLANPNVGNVRKGQAEAWKAARRDAEAKAAAALIASAPSANGAA